MEDRRFGVQHNQGAYSVSQAERATTTGIDAEAMKVLRNTYMLLGMTLAFSAVTAFLNMNGTHPGFLVTIVGYVALLFATYKLKNSPWGIVTTFALTGFMGYTLGPIIGAFVAAGASQIVAQALALTAIAFVGLSATAIITRKDFSFMSSFLTAGAFVLLGAMVLAIFMQSSALQLAISAGFTVFASLMILFETSQIIKGGERNYILATVGLYVSIYNLFLSLLQLLAAFSGED
ncbi:Bax inhibitor-1/YccA family protein [Marinobacter lutaoensis]|jgi:modulator of FtsH protease|uniref:BAX inhibitor protein n=1 Tax=Marinobacter lutaoensis TaxID=135739 RepID=A0A1V2DV67_9GAMM|nr:Bax inhibitor-1/YccA family protein [Marinobacter lutaoensis]MBE01825.1 BAX inhibitor (BI)-1/YccA family protein [Marinobacter sp.]MBI42747.1 BAX inhibitor (BI)-1/YccA family protein [Oceanospirillales bacterium]NVD35193.1 Bax inhibitor-1/YccA family protein [Marinobacter lutaoensis]ONF44171.1 BAX inhibitor protein [Marinobacter lutaoensis]|tara:strand:- start:4046 stop:4747 length:702 start_codon:yes stop_codon:yes gene_type:complete